MTATHLASDQKTLAIQGASIDDNTVQMCFLPQVLAFSPTLTGRETIRLFALIEKMNAPNDLVKDVADQLNKFGQSKLYKKFDERISHWSYGEARLLSIFIVFCLPNKLVFLLDEPTNGLDIAARAVFWKLVEQVRKSSSIIWSTHELGEIDDHADQVVLISRSNASLFPDLDTFVSCHNATSALDAFNFINTD